MALAVVVLIAAGLLARSFARLRAADPGFDPSNLLSFRIPMAGGRNAARERRAIFLDQLEERVSALPGVRAVGAVNTLPFGGLGVGAAFAVAGRPAPPPGQRPLALLRAATPGYWRAIGIPLIAGRVFSAADSGDAARVAIVNSKLARRYWPAGDAVGGHLTLDMASSTVVEIVGVVGDTRPERLEGEDWPTVYVPFRQSPPASMTVVARGALPPRSLAGEIERAVHELDSEQPVADVRPMEDTLSRVLAAPRFDMALLGILAQIAFALAAIGIYGVISYDVGQRTNELGIRAALGARPAALLALVLKQAAVLAACGIAVGVAAAFALTRLMKDMLYQTGSADAWTFTLAPLLLAAVALLACYIPARRAMALDPATALRHE
jgi:putative ABC transport system permease protein